MSPCIGLPMKADLRGLRAGWHALAGLAVLLACAPALGASKERIPGVTVEGSRVYDPERDGDPVINNLERRTFRFFWDTTNKQNGMAPDRWPSPSFASTAGIGFALTAYVIGAERGFVSRSQARLRTLRTLRFLANAPQGPEETGMAGYRGFYYHFLHMQNGQRFGTSELSTVDTALLLGGVLLAQMYFDRDTRAEKRDPRPGGADLRPRRVDLGAEPSAHHLARLAARDRVPALRLARLQRGDAGLHPGARLADASGRAGGVDANGLQTYKGSWGTFSGQEFLSFGPMFGHQYSHVWIDFRGIQDEFMREKGIDYFENSRRAAYAHREYSRAESDALARLRQRDLGPDRVRWSGGHGADLQQRGARLLHVRGARHGRHAPARRRHDRADRRSRLHRVRAGDRDPDDPRVPRALRRAPVPEVRFPRCGEPELHVRQTCRCVMARIVENIGWVDTDYLSIDQGPIVAMIENYRSGLIWKLMQRHPHIRRGLERAGFTGGWLAQPPPPQPSS